VNDWATKTQPAVQLCDMELVTQLNTPAFIFTDENVETAGIPATFNDGYGDVHIDGFKTLWGIK